MSANLKVIFHEILSVKYAESAGDRFVKSKSKAVFSALNLCMFEGSPLKLLQCSGIHLLDRAF